jgi:mono/diheme cytochrome c family protein
MRLLLAALALCFCSLSFGSFSGARAAEPALLVAAGGKIISLKAAELAKRPDAAEITLDRDFVYGRSMTYRAVKLAALLPEADAASVDAFFEIKALDGFVSQLPGRLVRNRDPKKAVAWIAIEDPASPWPILPDQAQSPGPFRLLWTGQGVDAIRREQWAYQIAAITEVESPEKRWPQLALPASLPAEDPRRLGQQSFIDQCLVCHKLAGGGNAEIGPDLNRPMSPTEYFTLPALRKYLRDPASLRTWPERKMPGFEPSALSDAEIDAIIAYLQLKAETRK